MSICERKKGCMGRWRSDSEIGEGERKKESKRKR